MKVDLTGKKIGSWTVLAFAKREKSRTWWHCKCCCGKVKDVQERTLLSGESKSCGCENAKKKYVNVVGQKFGKLLVVSFAYSKEHRTYWNCVCDCGNVFVACGKRLKNGTVKSCGCINHGEGKLRNDLTGRVFGELTAIKWLGVVKNVSLWECKCSCGNTTNVASYSLISGNTKSCGCKHYPETDTKELAELFNKHTSTINFVKKRLFGKHLRILTKEQIAKLDYYFKHTNVKAFSEGEKEVASFVRSIYKGKVRENYLKLIAPKELDIYVPEKRFAIEYDGLYWHSSKIKDMNYHLEKTRACAEKGVRLLHIYENEWRDKQDIVKSMIASALGVYDKKYFARNLTVKEVRNKKEVIDFFNENHIQGAVNRFSLCLGLYNKEELIQAVVFGKQHFGRNGDMELYRMVTKKNTQVVGGFSRLMKNCPYDTVVSYVALRLFDAKGYCASGWKIEHQAKPSFCVTDFVDVYSRHLFKKSECLKLFDNVTPNMTETEMCERNGLYKIWDCGTYKVRWNRY